MSDNRPNPEWTDEDFARAGDAASLTEAEQAAFPKTRGAQKAPTKVPVYIRLDQDVVAAFKAGGKGWQSRINRMLRQGLESPRAKRTGQVVKVGAKAVSDKRKA